jgi:hypothetical protein
MKRFVLFCANTRARASIVFFWRTSSRMLRVANTLARASLPALAVLGIARLAPEGVVLGQRL